MTAHRMTKIFLVCVWVGALFLSGCASFMKPEIGALARQDARINLKAGGVQNAAWNAKDLLLTYSYSEAGDTFNLAGTLSFDRSLTDSFPAVKRFFLKMSFLDSEGRVLETVDITPLLSTFGAVPDNLTVKASIPKPAGASAIAFNYFGAFMSGSTEGMGGSQWQISYFPFE
ncbi:hypothetical protein FCL47_20995 [Desulfopila sp. IMCC35006]|uniref:hypothetical protein n=1 Tax=Desulfopila sp. IMCC35006 TaxID=2569542 RepID=UPI0010AB727D|nr:hypothetical protein [Desulfopila sp. IMCC35006]TKB23812.1 hypothetical protein FCL47_20995 [Desulfopila sp. IMCC35006]